MRKLFLPLSIAFALVACSESSEKNKVSTDMVNTSSSKIKFQQETGGPAYTFDHVNFNFGSIQQGQVVEHAFQFVNSGDEPLIITDAKGSCGCTVPEWPKDPIQPGETGLIEITFNSKGKRNHQDKVVTLKSNAKGEQATTRLHIIGEVVVAETSN